MTELKQFDEIRPFEPEELPEAYERLLADEQFRLVLGHVFPEMDVETIGMMMQRCLTSLDFQKVFCYSFLEDLLEKASTSCTMDVSAVEILKRYTFVSNHRDIVLDSAILSKLLVDYGFSTTCEVAIGDNLLSRGWVKDLARINKTFIVERSLQPRQMLMASQRMSEYMHYVIKEKNDNIWIAQREGRAKDSNDLTQPALLKMMAMGGEGSLAERLKQLHIVPLAISYEYDPCDYLKAQEFQLKRDVEGWKKSAEDDVVSMQTGIMGWKGDIHYQCAPCIDNWLTEVGSTLSRTEFFDATAKYIDKEIHRNYKIYANNYVAADLLTGKNYYANNYADADVKHFEEYLAAQIEKIDLPNKDIPFLRERMLTMYANPLFNYEKANKSN